MIEHPSAARASLADLEAWLGRETSFEGIDEVTRSDIRRKLEVYCFDCPLYTDSELARAHGYRDIIAPSAMTPLWSMPAYWTPGEPTMFAPGLPEHSGTVRMEMPNPFSKGFNASAEVENVEPVYPGDRLRGTSKLVEITPKRTRLGEGVFLTSETKVWKQTGELVSITRSTGYRYDPSPERLEAMKSQPREATPAREQQVDASNPDVDWNRQLMFEDVNVGDEVPPYRIWLSYRRIVMSVAID